MTKKDICEECNNNEVVFKCVSCGKYLCEECAEDSHLCLCNAIEEVKDKLYIDIEDIDSLEED
jgi:hypothetical protein